jgi:hypothetical protein
MAERYPRAQPQAGAQHGNPNWVLYREPSSHGMWRQGMAPPISAPYVPVSSAQRGQPAPWQCGTCLLLNPPGDNFCAVCGDGRHNAVSGFSVEVGRGSGGVGNPEEEEEGDGEEEEGLDDVGEPLEPAGVPGRGDYFTPGGDFMRAFFPTGATELPPPPHYGARAPAPAAYTQPVPARAPAPAPAMSNNVAALFGRAPAPAPAPAPPPAPRSALRQPVAAAQRAPEPAPRQEQSASRRMDRGSLSVMASFALPDSGFWSCTTCSFHNVSDLAECEMCLSPRPKIGLNMAEEREAQQAQVAASQAAVDAAASRSRAAAAEWETPAPRKTAAAPPPAPAPAAKGKGGKGGKGKRAEVDPWEEARKAVTMREEAEKAEREATKEEKRRRQAEEKIRIAEAAEAKRAADEAAEATRAAKREAKKARLKAEKESEADKEEAARAAAAELVRAAEAHAAEERRKKALEKAAALAKAEEELKNQERRMRAEKEAEQRVREARAAEAAAAVEASKAEAEKRVREAKAAEAVAAAEAAKRAAAAKAAANAAAARRRQPLPLDKTARVLNPTLVKAHRWAEAVLPGSFLVAGWVKTYRANAGAKGEAAVVMVPEDFSGRVKDLGAEGDDDGLSGVWLAEPGPRGSAYVSTIEPIVDTQEEADAPPRVMAAWLINEPSTSNTANVRIYRIPRTLSAFATGNRNMLIALSDGRLITGRTVSVDEGRTAGSPPMLYTTAKGAHPAAVRPLGAGAPLAVPLSTLRLPFEGLTWDVEAMVLPFALASLASGELSKGRPAIIPGTVPRDRLLPVGEWVAVPVRLREGAGLSTETLWIGRVASITSGVHCLVAEGTGQRLRVDLSAVGALWLRARAKKLHTEKAGGPFPTAGKGPRGGPKEMRHAGGYSTAPGALNIVHVALYVGAPPEASQDGLLFPGTRLVVDDTDGLLLSASVEGYDFLSGLYSLRVGGSEVARIADVYEGEAAARVGLMAAWERTYGPRAGWMPARGPGGKGYADRFYSLRASDLAAHPPPVASFARHGNVDSRFIDIAGAPSWALELSKLEKRVGEADKGNADAIPWLVRGGSGAPVSFHRAANAGAAGGMPLSSALNVVTWLLPLGGAEGKDVPKGSSTFGYKYTLALPMATTDGGEEALVLSASLAWPVRALLWRPDAGEWVPCTVAGVSPSPGGGEGGVYDVAWDAGVMAELGLTGAAPFRPAVDAALECRLARDILKALAKTT